MSVKTFLTALLAFSYSVAFAQQKGYYQTPCINKNTVVFTAEGDLWKFDLNTNLATRLTTNPGVETNPSISPDGKWLAFAGQYEGVKEMYLMDINGGVPKRMTYDLDAYDFMISGWTKDGKILYRTGAYTALPIP